jgi:membrane-associated phospholipid phosphatase
VRTQRLLLVTAFPFGLGFVASFFVALHTARGLHYDDALFRRVSGSQLVPVETAGERALGTIDVGSLLAGAAVLAFLALARGRVARALAAVALVGTSVVSVELLKHGLPRLAGALPAGRPPTFPSGHTAVAVSLGLALVLAAPPVLRPLAAVAGATYAAGIGLSVIALGWHYPSDVVGSFCVCGFWACVAGALSGGTARRPAVSIPGFVAAVVAVALGLLLAAFVASRHSTAVAELRSRESLVGMAALLGALSLSTFAALTPLFEERGR